MRRLSSYADVWSDAYAHATPGFDTPQVAARAPGGNLYFAQDQAVASLIPPGSSTMELDTRGESIERPISLMFGHGTATTGDGQQIVQASQSSKGHVSEILNFHGSPAPWILLGILLAAGILHLEAGAKLKGSL